MCLIRSAERILLAALLVALSASTSGRVFAQEMALSAIRTGASLPESPAPAVGASPTIFPHSTTSRYLVSGQANIILQGHGPFHSDYQGLNSFLSRGEYKTSLIGTVYMGLQLRRAPGTSTDLILDVESAGGRGDSEALGLAGFTNLDVVRNPNLGSTPYIARVQLHQTIGLSNTLVDVARMPFSLSTKAPERRLEFHVGKMGLPDYLDANSIGSDSHLQFLNWTVDNNGAWDYAADTRGYTYGVVTEYIDKNWTARSALALMPTVANGINLDWNVRRASGQNYEVELRHNLLGRLVAADRKGIVRTLAFVNHAHMGSYREAVAAYLAGTDATPTIVAHEHLGAVKYGFGLNFEQELTDRFRLFGRFGWNEGQHESFAYTEVDQTIEFGGDYAGSGWSRPNDKVGVAFVTNAIKRDHQDYLRLGGMGFLLGDGRLNYAREDILEAYYTVHTWRGVYYALDTQYISHPGYNQDRGPVLVSALRMHVDF